jgi:tetratricopeptide (TPR) repeat protein
LRYNEAAGHFANAAAVFPPGSTFEDKRIGYLEREADALYRQGSEFGDNGALLSAIGRWKRLVELQPRERVPRDWAMIQNNLGNALSRLGERESGTAKLDEAVAAYREALKERTRERVPRDWARTQSNLGNALSRLGGRESGTAKLEEAVAAYREALKEFTRERAPLAWATTQMSLGCTLFNQGDFAGAALDLQELVDGTDAYPILWLYLAGARIGRPDAKSDLERSAAGLNPSQWPYPVIDLFREHRTPEAMVAAAEKPEKQCEAQYYLGQWHLVRGASANAMKALRNAVESCPKTFIEYGGAVAELKRFGQWDNSRAR